MPVFCTTTQVDEQKPEKNRMFIGVVKISANPLIFAVCLSRSDVCNIISHHQKWKSIRQVHSAEKERGLPYGRT